MGSETVQYPIEGHWVRSKAIELTSGTIAVIDVPANTFIPPFGVVIDVVTLFAGGTPSIDVGDGSDTDGWIDTTNITETTAAMYAGTAAAGAAYSVTGKVYTSADTIDVVVSTGLTAGKAYVFAYLVPIGDVLD
jgi:hypothetical protein